MSSEKVDSLEAKAKTAEEVADGIRLPHPIGSSDKILKERLQIIREEKRLSKEKWVRLADVQQQIQKQDEIIQQQEEELDEQKTDFIDHISKLNDKFRVLEGRLKECEKEFARQLERLSDLKAKDSKERLNQARQLIQKYPKCKDCEHRIETSCVLPIIVYEKIQDVKIGCPKDKLFLKLLGVLGEDKTEKKTEESTSTQKRNWSERSHEDRIR